MKKAQSDPLHYVILAAILLVVAIIVIFMFQNIFGKETGILGENIKTVTSKEDFDSDGVYDFLDKCPCTNKDGTKYPEIDAAGCGYDPNNEAAKEKLDSSQLDACKKKLAGNK